MAAAALLAELQAEGFVLSDVAGRLRCESPAGRVLSESQRAALRAHRDALLKVLQRSAAIPSAPRHEPAPASIAQRRLWYLESTRGDEPSAYAVPTLLRLRGRLDAAALQRALNRLVARHEILRTAIVTRAGQPWQEILPQVALPLPLEDCPASALPARVAELALQPFDLAEAPLLRARLFRSGPEDHSLLLLQHHIVTDGWSVQAMVAGLAEDYAAALAQASDPAPQASDPAPQAAGPAPQVLQYADYSRWQAGELSDERLAAKLAHWLPRLQDIQPIELPLDRPRPQRLGTRGGHHHLRLPAALTDAARRLAAARRTTLFAVLLSAFKLLLLRYSGQRDLVVGTPVANRPREELADMLGFFINILPLRSDLSAVEDVTGLIERVDETLHHALSHQDVPFDRLVSALQLERDAARSPLFQVIFALQSANRETAFRFADLQAELTVEADYPIAKAELTFSLQEIDDGLALRVEWNEDLYARASVERMALYYRRLLEAMVRQPDARLGALPMVSGEDFQSLVLEAGRAQRPYERDAGVLELFAAQVAARPEASAIVFAGESLTYGELATRARRLARHLEAAAGPAGLPAGSRIVLCLERSIDFVVAALACFELRALFVPIDPAYPAARIALLLADVEPALAITHAAAGEAGAMLQTAGGRRPLNLTEAAAAIAAEDGAPLGRGGEAEDAAYICYTSGTTGRPKGVVVDHRAIVRLVRNTNFAELKTGTRIVFGSNTVFDAATLEVWGALLNGGCLLGLSQDDLLDADRLEAFLARERPDVLWLTTALFEQLAERRPRLFRHVDTLLTGGSKHNPQIMRRLLEDAACRPRRIVNGYGPTENTTFSTTFEVERLPPEQASVPIGRPIANSTAYVLSPDGQPQPVGVPGELCVGGDGVAIGYFRQPELTAERFGSLTLHHPDHPEQTVTDRVYRTGDVVRWLPDRTLEFLGRRDSQVKLRGFRIELGEIEAALLACPGVVHAAVQLQAEQERPQIAAWYVAADASLTTARLRERLAEQLPAYMMPGALMRLEAMPLSASGKVDLAALPAIEPQASEAAGGPPQGPAEEALAAIWCELLRLETVGRDDSFFAIGGDSILSIQVVARARAAGFSFTPRQLFEAGTIARLAAIARPAEAAQTPAAGYDPAPLAMTPIQRWFFALPLPQRDHFNQALLLSLETPLSAALLSRAAGLLVARHEALRLRFAYTAEGGWQQSAAPATAQDWPVRQADLADATPRQAEAIGDLCSAWQEDFSIEAGRVFAIGLIDGHPDGHQRLFLAAHHLVVDGVSWRILLADLQRLCTALAGGSVIEPPPPDGTLRIVGETLEGYARSAGVIGQRDYWLAAAAGGRFLPPQPATAPAGDTQVLTARLDPATTAALLQRAGQAYGAAIDDLLLTALTAALCDWSGHRRATIALEGHGREDGILPIDLSETVGWFTSLYPVALELPEAVAAAGSASDWSALLPAVKERLRAVPDKGLGFGALRYLARDAAIAALPPAELSFNYLGRFDGAPGGWRMAAEAPGRMVAPRNAAPHPLDLTALVLEGRLEVRLSLDGQTPLPAPAAALLEGFLEALRSLVAHCLAQSRQRRTPSDFPASSASQGDLDRILDSLPAPPARLYDLTPLQAGLLFHARHGAGSDQYLVQFQWDMAGPLDPERLRQAWQQVIADHDALRSGFLWQGLTQPQQYVAAEATLGWQEFDWSDAGADLEATTAAFLAADRGRTFDLAAPCPMRVALARLADGGWRCVWTQHHILFDGWCLPLLLADVDRAYRQLGGEPVPPPAPALSFESYVAWQRRQEPAAARAFWRAQLAGIEEPTDIPVKRSGTLLQGNRPIAALGSRSFALAPDLDRRLNALARAHAATMNAVLQLAWGLLLSRYSGKDSVVHGTIVSGRANELPHVERMIGLAINSLPVRQDFPPEITAAQALARVNRCVQEINDHSGLSLPDIQAESAVPAGEPLFHSLLVFENYPAEGLAGDGPLRPLGLQVHEKTSYPLLLMAIPGETLTLRLDYDAACFDEPAMARLEGHLLTLLEGLAAAPEAPVATLPLMTAAERAALADWQGPAVAFDDELTITALIERQVARTPDAIAVAAEEGVLSYRELDRAAAAFAARLLRRHAEAGRPLRPDTPVGLCLERGLGMIVAMLGILKAGGAYMPLDPDHPDGRLAEMLADSGAQLVATDRAMAGRMDFLAALPAERRLCIDEPTDVPAEAASGEAGPRSLAYVIYTSGSTGRPKGVAIEHRSLVNRLQWMQHAYPIGAEDRVLQKTPFSFDVSVWEFFWPLLTGARLVFARPQGHRDPAYLCRIIAEAGITTLHFVPSMLQAFVERPELSSLTGMRQLFCSGEGLPTQLTRRLLEALPALGVHNLYGPTEATVDVSWHHCRLADSAAGPVTPIGRPVWNTELHVLDPRQRPLPVGVPGELWLGGVQLARGYLNRPDLTDERFRRNPFGPGRLYRTGDLVQRRADGVIDYLGRTDFQVKIRGVRIELGEIDAALERHPEVRQSCLLARGSGLDTALAAYYTAPQALDPATLRAFLAAALPDAMVPARFIWLERFPLTTSGKVDRNALPKDAPVAAVAAAAPRNPLEAAVCGIFAEVLGLENVGPEQDFFALGGHSLKAMQVVARLLDRLGVDLPLPLVFEHRTAAALARHLPAASREDEALPLAAEAPDGPQPLSFAQERLWFLQRFLAEPALYNVPAVLRLSGPLEVAALSAAIERCIERHAILRSRIRETADDLGQIVLPPQPLRLVAEPVAAAETAAVLQAEARRPFDLAKDPPIRCRLFRLGAQEHLLCLLLHHHVTDAWSLDLLLQEIAAGYRDAAPASPAQPDYLAYARWQRSRLDDRRLAPLVAYWSRTLADTPTLALPTDRPRPALPSHRGGLHRFALGGAQSAALRALAQREGGTAFTVLLSLFLLLLAKRSGQRDILVGTPVANRSRLELEAMQGLFTNTLVLRNRLQETGGFAALLRGVTAQTLEAFAHQDLPFELLVEALQVPRDPSRSALFQVFFILQDAARDPDFGAAGPRAATVPLDHGTAKFDLTLAFEESEQDFAGVFEYALDLFEPQTIAAMATEFTALLSQVLAAPEAALPLDGPGQPAPAAPAPATGRDLGLNDRALRGDLERRIGAIWQQLLPQAEVGARASFFELGGTSLSMMRLQLRLKEAFGQDLPMVSLFANPTVEAQAKLLAAEGAARDDGTAQASAQDRSRQRRSRQGQRRRAP